MRTREDERTRLFSEQVDRILAGGRAAPGGDLDDDFRSALNFAQDIAAMTPAPRAAFQGALDARLRTRMAELEEKARVGEKRSWWQRLVARPAWLVAAAAVFVVAVGVLIWASGLFQPAAVPTGPVSVSASTNKTRYTAGETVNVRVYLENTSGSYLYVDKYPPNVSIMDGRTHQPVYTTAAGTQGRSISAAPAYFDVQWDQRDESGQVVAPGRYYIELEDLTGSGGQPIPLRLAKPVEFEVLH